MLPNGPYNSKQTEEEMLNFWLENNFYKPEYDPKAGELLTPDKLISDDRETFTVICPPPNANGNLHLGHMSGYAYQDLMGRYNRMKGKKVLLLPGKDHAGIQTEVVFEKELEKKGKTKHDLGRDAFYRACYQFCMENSLIARGQEQKIGLSADFERELFTLDPRIVHEVTKAFKLMYDDGLVYRGKRLINWCVRDQSALADIDTEFKDAITPFVYFKYGFVEPEDFAVKIRDTFAGKEVEWKYERFKSKKKKDFEFPSPYGELVEEFKNPNDADNLDVIGIGYENDEKLIGETFKGKAIGIMMRLDKNYNLIVVNPDFDGDIDKEIEKNFLTWIKLAAGAHIIKFDEYKEDKFYNNGFILATVRPETKFGDTALAVDPDDERYKEFVGNKYKVRTLNGEAEMTIISDNAVEQEFGTGMVKVTPAHALEDWDIAMRHPKESFPEKQVIGFDGKMNHLTGKYEGLTVNEARRQIIPDMKEIGMLVHLDEKYENRIRICERCKSRIEPLVSYQWFVDTKPLKEKAKNLVKNGTTDIMPEGRKNTYLDWMNSPEDWCITRQLWWGYRIPVWFKEQPTEYISETGEVKEKLGGKIMESDKDYDEFMKVSIENPDKNLKAVLVPGKHGFMHRKLYPEILAKYPKSISLIVENIDNPRYEDFEKEFSKVDFNEFKTVVAHSIGCRATLQYILKNKIEIDNLILIAPAAREPRDKDRESNYISLWDMDSEYPEIKNYVKEVFIIGSNDDELIPESNFKKFAKTLNARMLLEVGKKHFAGHDYDKRSDQLDYLLKQFNNEVSTWLQDEDVLDTWFSSGQWPYVTLKATEGDFETFYPTQVMETGWDILLFWVTRMMLLDPYRAEKEGLKKDEEQTPFANVYLHGLVLDKEGQKMSKSKGNGIDPYEMMQKYGTDALRFSFVAGNAAGQNYRLYEEKISANSRFINKLWNASKFVLMNAEHIDAKTLESFDGKNLKQESNKLLYSHITELKDKVTRLMDTFQFGVSAQILFEEFWHNFADIHIENSKVHMYKIEDKKTGEIKSDPSEDEKIETQTLLLYTIREYLKMFHPFIPFVTERIWKSMVKIEGDHESMMYTRW